MPLGLAGSGRQMEVWSKLGSLPRSRALRARAETAQIIERVNAGGMTVVPIDLHSISSYEFCAVRFQRFDTQQRQKARWLPSRLASLAASSAGAVVAKIAVRINAGMAIRPQDR
jgi:hypothetical protein